MTLHSLDVGKLALDYSQLFEQPQPTIILTLHRTTAGWYSVTDQDGCLYFPPTPNADTCLRFMQAFVRKNPGATIDNLASAHDLARALSSGGAVGTGPTPPDTNVIPINRTRGAA